jgi:hypothetical protein
LVFFSVPAAIRYPSQKKGFTKRGKLFVLTNGLRTSMIAGSWQEGAWRTILGLVFSKSSGLQLAEKRSNL